jgi:MSHA biogenesis protein MshO
MRQKYKINLSSGFTLVEMVVVISVMAIIGGMSTVFIPRVIQGYVNSETYFQLVDMADNSLRRIKRDVRNAVSGFLQMAGLLSFYLSSMAVVTETA